MSPSSTAVERAAAAGQAHLNRDGVVIRTERVAAADPIGAGPVTTRETPISRWEGTDHRDPGGRACGRLAATLGIPSRTDLGYENTGDGYRHPVNRPQHGQLAEPDRTFNGMIRGVHGTAQRANALRKVTFSAARRA